MNENNAPINYIPKGTTHVYVGISGDEPFYYERLIGDDIYRWDENVGIFVFYRKKKHVIFHTSRISVEEFILRRNKTNSEKEKQGETKSTRFTKNDLVPYKHIVEVEGGSEDPLVGHSKYYLVTRSHEKPKRILFVGGKGFCRFDEYDDDLTARISTFNIVAVYEVDFMFCIDLKQIVNSESCRKVYDSESDINNNDLKKEFEEISQRIDDLVFIEQEKKEEIEQVGKKIDNLIKVQEKEKQQLNDMTKEINQLVIKRDELRKNIY